MRKSSGELSRIERNFESKKLKRLTAKLPSQGRHKLGAPKESFALRNVVAKYAKKAETGKDESPQ